MRTLQNDYGYVKGVEMKKYKYIGTEEQLVEAGFTKDDNKKVYFRLIKGFWSIIIDPATKEIVCYQWVMTGNIRDCNEDEVQDLINKGLVEIL